MKLLIFHQTQEQQQPQITAQMLLQISPTQTQEQTEVVMITTRLQECGLLLIVVVIQITARKR